jgi:hypothetical protein
MCRAALEPVGLGFISMNDPLRHLLGKARQFLLECIAN